jgi:pimeloyl-ACP methyl ester carboxylesterase
LSRLKGFLWKDVITVPWSPEPFRRRRFGREAMSLNDVSVMLVHGAWADGSSWSKIIRPLAAQGLEVSAPPLPLTSFQDDVAALDRTLERATGPVVLVGHAYAGAIIAATRSEKVKALVYAAARGWRTCAAILSGGGIWTRCL